MNLQYLPLSKLTTAFGRYVYLFLRYKVFVDLKNENREGSCKIENEVKGMYVEVTSKCCTDKLFIYRYLQDRSNVKMAAGLIFYGVN